MATIRRRGVSWQVQVRRMGQRPVSKTFKLKKDADTWARHMESRADRFDLPAHQDPRLLERTTLRELVLRYREEVSSRKRGGNVEQIVLNAFLRHPICRRSIAELQTSDFAAYRDHRLKTVQSVTLRRQLAPIHNLFEIARDEWGLPIRENPLAKLRLDKRTSRRERRLRAEEFDKITRQARLLKNPLILQVILFALQTGMRRGEILAMEWGHLEFSARTLHIPQAKNGHARTIPLSDSARTVIDALPRQHSRVFPISANAFQLTWQRLLDRCDITDLHFHDLRHEAISRFFEMGLSVPDVALLSGHRDARMLLRYAHSSRERVLRLMEASSVKRTRPSAPDP